MRKHILLLVFSSSLLLAFGQISVGLKIGVGANFFPHRNIYAHYSFRSYPREQGNVGGFLSMKFKKKGFFAAELFYLGLRNRGEIYHPNWNYYSLFDYKYRCLNLPVKLGYTLKRFVWYGGVELTTVLAVKDKMNNIGSPPTLPGGINPASPFDVSLYGTKRFIFGLTGGMIAAFHKNIAAEFSYSYALTPTQIFWIDNQNTHTFRYFNIGLRYKLL